MKWKSGFVLCCYLTLLWVPISTADRSPEAAFDALLRAHVDDGDVNYAGFRDNPIFDKFLHYIARKQFSAKASKDEKIAFYINAYNALAIKGIVDGYGPDSIFGRVQYFYQNRYRIAGNTLSLYDVEHEWIRPLGEPRVHFALVCASRSCPKLRPEVYSAASLDSQLNENAAEFLNDPEKNVYDLRTGKARISKVFSWYAEDFGGMDKLQPYLAKFIDDRATRERLARNGFSLKFKFYDWSLNGNSPNDTTK